jgi:Domain of unknown function (DUF4062)
MDKRYQVFVSSTYADLKEERSKVIQTIMEMDCIPSGMELFPAADEEQFEFIKRVIEDCDYYILIIGGRYGSLTAEGISYTEKEYEYAIEKGIKVIALLHENPDDIAYGKSEQDPQLRQRLQAFRNKVAKNRLVKFWNSADELPGLVALSLSKAIKMFPAIGWVRASQTSSVELLNELNEVRKEKEKLDTEIQKIKDKKTFEIPNLAPLDETIEIKVENSHFDMGSRKTRYSNWEKTVTWLEIFGLIAPHLLSHPSDSSVKTTLESSLAEHFDKRNGRLQDEIFQTIKIQFQAHELINVRYSKTTAGGMNLFWSLTPVGERLMMAVRTVKSSG